jgi:BMFP domain-containing protein YqiC
MIDFRVIDDLTRRLGESLPPGLVQKKDELEGQFRAVLTGAFERMNLVSREEFDAKCALLDETRSRLAELEAQLEEIESA